VLDSAGRLPLLGNLARTAPEVPVLVAVTERASSVRRAELVQLGCELLVFPGSGVVPVPALLEELGRRGMTNLLIEGGGQVTGSFLDAGQVDAVEVFLAPILEGGDHARTGARGRGRVLMSDAPRLLDLEVTQVGDDVHLRGRLPQPWRLRAGFQAE
jgi:diaminohydroxyphosphoribosylaminopyrimidine deaminase/5-amino-6-(5-phosphoribosylamino)uracil reductase